MKSLISFLLVLIALIIELAQVVLYWLPVRIIWGKNTFNFYGSDRDCFPIWLDENTK